MSLTDDNISSSKSKSQSKCWTKRSSSDGAMKALEAQNVTIDNGLSDKNRSRSECDDLIARMKEKFNKIERESELRFRYKSENNDNSDNNDHKLNERFSRSLSVAEVKEQAYCKLHLELKRAQTELKLRDEEVAKLSRIKDEVESELEDLTASLFEEANNMVYNANVLRTKAEKELHEANLMIDVLQAEVQALKMLVLTSTPSKPNPHLHPQIHNSNRNGLKSTRNKTDSNILPNKSPSNYELGGNPVYAQNGSISTQYNDDYLSVDEFRETVGEVDPIFHEEFAEWKKSPLLDPIKSNFIKRIYDEEIYPLFNFKDKDLTCKVLRAIEDNSIIIEVVAESNGFPKRCALLDAPRFCKYRMKIGDIWYNISQLCRNRIIAICDLFCYLRYIQRGLVKSSFHEIYWQIMQHRRNIALSKLGFSS